MKKIIYVITALSFLTLISARTPKKGEAIFDDADNSQTPVIRPPENLPEPREIETSLLCDKSATENARRLYNYLREMYGKKVISGQMENAWNANCNMLERVYKDTGKYPAIMGFDFMNYTSAYNTGRKQEVERAIKFWNGQDYKGNKISDKHGIVTFCWHWRDPLAPKGKTGDFYTKNTDFRIPYDTKTNKWDVSSEAYSAIIEDFDVVAAQLSRLQEAGIPVLWRPLHEAAGNVGSFAGGSAWFWWGAGNQQGQTSTNADVCGQSFIALWKLMYNYFTQTKGLHNLIWVWNGQSQKFYPGSEYVDIIGNDIYESYLPSAKKSQVYKSNKNKFERFQSWDTTKITALTECGNLPDVSTDGALWSFFMVWNDGEWDSSINGVSKASGKNNFWSGDFFNSAEKKKEIYVKNSNVITLDELPDFTK